MLTAMTTGHEWSLSTLHAWSPGDAIRRAQTLTLMAIWIFRTGPSPISRVHNVCGYNS